MLETELFDHVKSILSAGTVEYTDYISAEG